MWIQNKQMKRAKNGFRNLGFEKAARNCEESKQEQLPPSKNNKMVSLLEHLNNLHTELLIPPVSICITSTLYIISKPVELTLN